MFILNLRQGCILMKQEYIDKMKYYQGKEYENFLREKCVLDARQFLYSSQLYLNYAIITAKLYEDIGKKNISEGEKNPFYNSVEVLGWNYNAHTILNKLTLEWVSHISNSLDCLLQYINASLNLGLKQKAVTEGNMHRKLEKMPQINSYVEKLWENEIVCYIRSVYNYGKHTLDLYGGSSFADVISGQRDIRIPEFKYRGNIYKSKSTSELIGYYENFIGLYIDVMESVDFVLKNSEPVCNRYHVGKMVVDGHAMGECENKQDIVLYAEFDSDGIHIKKYWVEDIKFENDSDIEIMLSPSKTIGQHFDGITSIEVIINKDKVGELHMDSDCLENSILRYHKYKYVAV